MLVGGSPKTTNTVACRLVATNVPLGFITPSLGYYNEPSVQSEPPLGGPLVRYGGVYVYHILRYP